MEAAHRPHRDTLATCCCNEEQGDEVTRFADLQPSRERQGRRARTHSERTSESAEARRVTCTRRAASARREEVSEERGRHEHRRPPRGRVVMKFYIDDLEVRLPSCSAQTHTDLDSAQVVFPYDRIYPGACDTNVSTRTRHTSQSC